MAAVRTGWWTRNTLPWVKRSAAFGLAVTPQLGATGAPGTGRAAVGLVLTPTIGMAGAEREATEFAVGVTLGLGMSATGKSAADFGVGVTPQLSAAAGNHTPAAAGLVLTPSVEMAIAAVNPGTPFAFGLTVSPSLSMTGAERDFADFGLTVTPTIALGSGATAAAVGLAVTPTLGMDGGSRNPASVGLTVTPSISVSAAERYPASATVAVTPVVGAIGAARQPGEAGLTVTPSIGMSAKATTTYSQFPTVPAGTVNVAITSGAGAVQATSNTLQEGNCLASNGPYYSAAVLPDVMATDLFSVAVTVGALSGAASDRGVGAGVFSADGTKGVATVWQANSSTAVIRSWSGGSFTTQASLGSVAANAGDVVKLVPSVSAGVVTWTVHLNGTPTALSWPDSAHLVDLPGRHPAAVFRRAYNFAQYPSRGVAALTAADI